jgi:hypothetical protein
MARLQIIPLADSGKLGSDLAVRQCHESLPVFHERLAIDCYFNRVGGEA